jgi:hypothetical protein
MREYRNDPAAVVQARSTASAQPAAQPAMDEQPESNEDLEIPSFLRRLAN